MDIKKDRDFESKEELALIYEERLAQAKRGLGFHNCAGFTKYLLGLANKETFIRPGDASEKGLIKHLKQTAILPLDEYTEESYVKLSRQADAVAILQNDNNKWTYLHFFVPNPHPKHPLEIFQRNGFEEENAEKTHIKTVLNEEEYQGETTMVFFKKKKDDL